MKKIKIGVRYDHKRIINYAIAIPTSSKFVYDLYILSFVGTHSFIKSLKTRSQIIRLLISSDKRNDIKKEVIDNYLISIYELNGKKYYLNLLDFPENELEKLQNSLSDINFHLKTSLNKFLNEII